MTKSYAETMRDQAASNAQPDRKAVPRASWGPIVAASNQRRSGAKMKAKEGTTEDRSGWGAVVAANNRARQG